MLGEQGMLNPQLPTAPADALVLPMTDDPAAAIALATRLRSSGIRTQIYTEKKKFKAKMTYADKLGIPYVVFLGEDEIAAGKCSVKCLKTGEQVTVTAEEAAGLISGGIETDGTVIIEA